MKTDAEAALADQLQELVRPDLRPGPSAIGRSMVCAAWKRAGESPAGAARPASPGAVFLWRGALPRPGNGSPAGRLLVFAHRRCLPVDSPKSRRSCRKSPPAASLRPTPVAGSGHRAAPVDRRVAVEAVGEKGAVEDHLGADLRAEAGDVVGGSAEHQVVIAVVVEVAGSEDPADRLAVLADAGKARKAGREKRK